MGLRAETIGHVVRNVRTWFPLLTIVVLLWLVFNDPAVGEDKPAYTTDELHATVVKDSADTDSSDDQSDSKEPSLLQWAGESPHWTPGQEFSAVVGAPFIGSQECTYCHKSLKQDWLHTAHARTLLDMKLAPDQQGCEMCHGAGGAHAVLHSPGTIFAFDWKDPQATNQICLRCQKKRNSACALGPMGGGEGGSGFG